MMQPLRLEVVWRVGFETDEEPTANEWHGFYWQFRFLASRVTRRSAQEDLNNVIITFIKINRGL